MVKKVGRLTILEPVERPDHVKSGTAYWHCICYCGNSLRVSCDSLQKSLKGKKGAGARSCGCLNRELAAERMIGAIYDQIDEEKLDRAAELIADIENDVGLFPELQEAKSLLARFGLR